MVAQAVNPTDARVDPARRRYQPDIDLFETPDEWTLVADMPGVKAGDVKVDLDNGTLTLLGKAAPRQAAGTRYIFREYGVGDYHAAVSLGDTVDAGRISADVADGVLTLHLPKSGAAKSRTIEVRTRA